MNTLDFLKISTKPDACETHGDFEAKRAGNFPWSGCPTCLAIRGAEVATAEAAERERQRVESLARRIGFSGIPERFHDRTLESYRTGDHDGKEYALAFSIKFAAEFTRGKCAIFSGRPGTGKTHLACGIGLKLLQAGKSVHFSTILRAIRRVKATWSRDSAETEDNAIRAMTEPDFLILDEIGVQFGSDTEKQIFFDVMNARYEARKSTLLMSNLDKLSLIAFIGERSYDRIKEDGGEIIVFDWESERGSIKRIGAV